MSTVGLNEATIATKYMREQEKNDQIEIPLTSKEYRGPFKD